MREDVDQRCQKAMENFSFEVKPNWRETHYPEVDDLNTAAGNIQDGYRLLKRAGKFTEAKEYRKKLIETMYSAEHLKMVMSMDFENPKAKMREMLEESGASIHDEFV